MALTDVQIRNAKPRDKDYKLSDSGGLFLLVPPAGGKLWRDVLAQLGDGGLGDTGHTHGLGQFIGPSGADPADPLFLDHRD